MHELAHIWVGHSGISRIDETLRTPTLSIEELCNKVVTEALVPQAEFESKWSGVRHYRQISELSQHFLVSALVIIRRARELNKIQDDTLLELLAEAKKRFDEHVAVAATSEPKDQEGNFYTTLEARNSPTLVNALLADVRRDGTLFRDAARLLSMKVETVVKLIGGLNTS